MSRKYDDQGNPVYCAGSGTMARRRWLGHREDCPVCLDDPLVNADGTLRKHFARGSRTVITGDGGEA